MQAREESDHAGGEGSEGDVQDGLLGRVQRSLSSQRSFMNSAWRRAVSFGRTRQSTDEEQGQASPHSERVAAPEPAGSGPSAEAPAETCSPSAAPADSEAQQLPGRPSDGSQPEASSKVSTSPGGSTLHTIFGRLLRTNSGHLLRSSSNTGQSPTCLICLENLSPEDFESGEAMQLECQCRGELAVRHRACAEKWSRVKGDRVCDVCKAPIANLPEVTPRASSEGGTDAAGQAFDEDRPHQHGLQGLYMNDHIPGSADVIFDCIRVTWVAMIICILFFEMNLAMALWTGLIVGLAYTGFARAMYRTQLAAIQREMARDRERAANADTPTPPMVVVV